MIMKVYSSSMQDFTNNRCVLLDSPKEEKLRSQVSLCEFSLASYFYKMLIEVEILLHKTIATVELLSVKGTASVCVSVRACIFFHHLFSLVI